MLGKFNFRQFNSVAFNVMTEVLVYKLPNEQVQPTLRNNILNFTFCTKLKDRYGFFSVEIPLYVGIVQITEAGTLFSVKS